MKRLILLVCLLIVVQIGIASAGYYDPTMYLKFNENGNPSFVNDSTGTLNFTLNNSVANLGTGKLNNGIRINNSGSSALINRSRIPESLVFNSNPFTIALWINGTNLGGGSGYIIFGTNADSPIKWAISTQSGINNISFDTNSLSVIMSPNTTLNGSYNRIVFVREGTSTNQFKVYFNGQNFKNTTLSNNFSDNVTYWRTNGANGGSSGINLDDLRIYNNYAWSVADVVNDYNSGAGTEMPITTITLNSPSTNSFLTSNPVTFNASMTTTADYRFLNATIYVYNSTSLFNQTTLSLNGTSNQTILNISGFNIDSYVWNVRICTYNNFCKFADSNQSFYYGFRLNSELYVSPISEGQNNIFNLSINLNSSVSLSSAVLFYNSSASGGIISNPSNQNFFVSVSKIAPSVSSQQEIPFNWILILSNGLIFNITSHNQTVNNVEIDDCSTQTLRIVNFTTYDEDTLILLNTGKIELDLDIFALGGITPIIEFSANRTKTLSVCLSATALNNSQYSLDAQVRYLNATSNGAYATEFYYLQNYTLNTSTINQNISLYNLLTSRTTDFLITYKDSSFLPVDNALITLSRKYINEGLFRTVEIGKTDINGQTKVSLVANGEIYTFYIYKNGVLLSTFENQIVDCEDSTTGDCSLNLNELTSTNTGSDYLSYGNLEYSGSLNKTSRIYTLNYVISDGSSQTITVNITKYDSYRNTTACFEQLTSNSGTISCSISQNVGNATVLVEIRSAGVLVSRTIYGLVEDISEELREITPFLLIVMFCTLPLLFIGSPIMMIIGSMMAIILAVLIFFIDGQSLLGVGSAFMWFLIASIVIIYKISKRGEN